MRTLHFVSGRRRTGRREDRFSWMRSFGVLMAAAGCAEKPHTQSIEPLQERPPLLVAVAPALNLSGSADLDPVRLAELMAMELESFPSVDVVPVSRTLAILLDDGHNEVGSASEARELMERLGADAILVFAVTAYEPYEPPIVGIAAELYGAASESADADLASNVATGGVGALDGSADAAFFGTLAQDSTVYDASHDRVIERVKDYADSRGSGDRPLGWRKVLVSQTDFVEFCCHETAGKLLDSMGRRNRVAEVAFRKGGS